MVEILDYASQITGLSPLFMFFNLILGYFIFHTFFFKEEKIWRKFTGIDKLMWSIIIGFGTYYLIFFILKSYFGAFSILSYSQLEDGVFHFYTFIITTVVLIPLTLINIFTKLKYLKLNLLRIIYILSSILIIGWSFYLAQSVAVLFTAIDFLSKEIVIASLPIIFISLILLISYFVIENKKIRKFFSKDNFSVKSHFRIGNIISKIKYNKASVEETVNLFLIILIPIFFISGIIFGYFSYPKIVYDDTETLEYFFNGNGYSSSVLERDDRWISFKHTSSKFNITEYGIMGWVPVKYKVFINESFDSIGPKIIISTNESERSFNFENNYEDYLSRLESDIGISNITLNKNYQRVILTSKEQNSEKIVNMSIRGLEYEHSRQFSIKEEIPYKSNDGKIAIFKINVTNKYKKPITFMNFLLEESRDFHSSNCRTPKITGKLKYFGNNTEINLDCSELLYGQCLSNGRLIDDIDLIPEISNGNVIEIKKLSLTSQSSILLSFNLVCENN